METKQSSALSRKFILKQQYYHLSQLQQADDALDSKAASLLQLAVMVSILASLVNFSPIAIFVIFSVGVILPACVIFPKDTCTPGTQDWNELYEQYVYRESGDCFNQILSDCVEVADRLLKRNKSKARLVKWAIILFGFQVTSFLAMTLTITLW